jgi:hypothetical protein
MFFIPRIICLLSAVLLTWSIPFNVSAGVSRAVPSEMSPVSATSGSAYAESVILFVLEGIGPDSLKVGPMPLLTRLVKEGSATWSAQTVAPPLRLPAILDTGATVMRTLGLETHTEWDSRVMEEVFRGTGSVAAVPAKGR